MSSILKSQISTRKSLNRVSFALPNDLRLVLLEYASGEDPKSYEQLVMALQCDPGPECQQISFLQDCCKVIGLLDQRMQRLIITILNFRWSDGSNELALAYQNFVVELLTAHNYYTKVILEKLLALFKTARTLDVDKVWISAGPCDADLDIYSRIHEIISRILKVIPMAGELLVQVAIAGFPYMLRSPQEHQTVVYNLLKICEYQPALRPDILSLIISRMIAVDVQIPRESLEDELDDSDDDDDDDSEADDMEVDGQTEGDTLFAMDDVPGMSHHQSSLQLLNTAKRKEMKLPLAQTLDVVMEQLFLFMKRHCELDTPTNWQNHRELYRELCAIFDKQLLLTYGSHHVQFIMFYMCSMRPPTLADHFLGSLWSKVTQPGETAVSRQTAACYIASLLARGCFVTPRLLRTLLAQMANWCHAYVGAQQDVVSCDIRQHQVFYTVCQALFYVVAFRHADLVNTNKGLLWTQSLGLGKLVTSRINPLKPCQPGVAQNFASVTRTYQLAYCYTVLERNARAVLPCVSHHSGKVVNNHLSTFFPFDPYLLRRSAGFVSPAYRHYEPLEQPAGPATTSVPGVGASDGEEEHSTDEEDEELGVPGSPRTTKNVSLHQLISPSSFPDMFSYGTSPGFKHA